MPRPPEAVAVALTESAPKASALAVAVPPANPAIESPVLPAPDPGPPADAVANADVEKPVPALVAEANAVASPPRPPKRPLPPKPADADMVAETLLDELPEAIALPVASSDEFTADMQRTVIQVEGMT